MYGSIEEAAAAFARKGMKHYHLGAQQALRPVGTQFWLFFVERDPTRTTSGCAFYNATRYRVIGYEEQLSFPSFSWDWWTLCEKIAVHFEADGSVRDFNHTPSTTYFDDRGCYTDYPPEWKSFEAENAETFKSAMSAEDVLRHIVAAKKAA